MRERRLAFGLAVLVVATAVVLVALLEGPHARGRRPAAGAARRALVVGAPAAPTTSTLPGRPTLRDQHAVVAVGRAFALAFVRYEVGDLTPAVRRALQATATPAFAARLLASPPRPPAGAHPHAARVLAVSPGDTPPSAGVTAAVELNRGGALAALTLRLARAGGCGGDGCWRVADLG